SVPTVIVGPAMQVPKLGGVVSKRHFVPAPPEPVADLKPVLPGPLPKGTALFGTCHCASAGVAKNNNRAISSFFICCSYRRLVISWAIPRLLISHNVS